MNHTYIGDMKISQLMLGTVQLGMDYGISNDAGKPSQAHAFEILETAKNGGVTVLDTAADYGESESVIGNYLAQCGGDAPAVVTKFMIGLPQAGAHQAKEVEARLRKTIETSLERLKLNKLDFLLLHREEEITKYGDVLPDLLRKVKREGLVGHVGVSINTGSAVQKIAADELYEAVQLPMNLFDTSKIKNGAIKLLADSGKAIFVRSVFLQGLFFLEPESLTGDILKDAAQPLRELRALAEAEGMSLAELAVSFVRDTPGVTSLVLGVATPAQVVENLKLMEAPRLSEGTRAKILTFYENIRPEIMMPWTWPK